MNMKTYLENRIAEGLVRRIACQAWYSLPENDRRVNRDSNNKIIDKRQGQYVQTGNRKKPRAGWYWRPARFPELYGTDVPV